MWSESGGRASPRATRHKSITSSYSKKINNKKKYPQMSRGSGGDTRKKGGAEGQVLLGNGLMWRKEPRWRWGTFPPAQEGQAPRSGHPALWPWRQLRDQKVFPGEGDLPCQVPWVAAAHVPLWPRSAPGRQVTAAKRGRGGERAGRSSIEDQG